MTKEFKDIERIDGEAIESNLINRQLGFESYTHHELGEEYKLKYKTKSGSVIAFTPDGSEATFHNVKLTSVEASEDATNKAYVDALVEESNITTVRPNLTGFVNPDDIEVTFDTQSRDVVVRPKAGVSETKYYVNGELYSLAAAVSATVDNNVIGLFFVFLNKNGIIDVSQEWKENLLPILTAYRATNNVGENGTTVGAVDNEYVSVVRDYHGTVMDKATRDYLQSNIGVRLVSGCIAKSAVDGTSLNRTAGIIAHSDIEIPVTESAIVQPAMAYLFDEATENHTVEAPNANWMQNLSSTDFGTIFQTPTGKERSPKGEGVWYLYYVRPDMREGSWSDVVVPLSGHSSFMDRYKGVDALVRSSAEKYTDFLSDWKVLGLAFLQDAKIADYVDLTAFQIKDLLYCGMLEKMLTTIEDNQNLSEVLAQGNDAGGQGIVGVGSLGIGTNAPEEKLHVENGNIILSKNYGMSVKDDGDLYLGNRIGGTIEVGGDGAKSTIKARLNTLEIGTKRDTDDVYISAGDSEKVRLAVDGATGNIGIGTKYPQSKLHITSGEGANGPCQLILEADTNNAIESAVPYIEMRSDGSLIKSSIGIVPYTDTAPDGETVSGLGANSLAIGTNSTGIQFHTNNKIKMSIGTNGLVYAPDAALNELEVASDSTLITKEFLKSGTNDFVTIDGTKNTCIVPSGTGCSKNWYKIAEFTKTGEYANFNATWEIQGRDTTPLELYLKTQGGKTEYTKPELKLSCKYTNPDTWGLEFKLIAADAAGSIFTLYVRRPQTDWNRTYRIIKQCVISGYTAKYMTEDIGTTEPTGHEVLTASIEENFEVLPESQDLNDVLSKGNDAGGQDVQNAGTVTAQVFSATKIGKAIEVADGSWIGPKTDDGTKDLYITTGSNPNGKSAIWMTNYETSMRRDGNSEYVRLSEGQANIRVGNQERLDIDTASSDLYSPDRSSSIRSENDFSYIQSGSSEVRVGKDDSIKLLAAPDSTIGLSEIKVNNYSMIKPMNADGTGSLFIGNDQDPGKGSNIRIEQSNVRLASHDGTTQEALIYTNPSSCFMSTKKDDGSGNAIDGGHISATGYAANMYSPDGRSYASASDNSLYMTSGDNSISLNANGATSISSQEQLFLSAQDSATISVNGNGNSENQFKVKYQSEDAFIVKDKATALLPNSDSATINAGGDKAVTTKEYVDGKIDAINGVKGSFKVGGVVERYYPVMFSVPFQGDLKISRPSVHEEEVQWKGSVNFELRNVSTSAWGNLYQNNFTYTYFGRNGNGGGNKNCIFGIGEAHQYSGKCVIWLMGGTTYWFSGTDGLNLEFDNPSGLAITTPYGTFGTSDGTHNPDLTLGTFIKTKLNTVSTYHGLEGGTLSSRGSAYLAQEAGHLYVGDNVTLDPSGTNWDGAVIVGDDGKEKFVAGNLQGKAAIGGHNAALDSWSDLLINPLSGNVGIGTDTPDNSLRVNGQSSEGTDSNGNLFCLSTSDTQRFQMGVNSNGDGWLQPRLANFLIAPHGGNVGIGTDNPDNTLVVKGGKNRGGWGNDVITVESDLGDFPAISYKGTSGYSWALRSGDASQGNAFQFLKLNADGAFSGLLPFVINGNGNVGIGTTTPVAKIEVEGGAQVWSETTPGTTVGSVHLDPGTATDHAGNAITWGASDTSNGDTAQAGIYVRSDGTYGTKMYFATTDLYTAGSKNRMMIDHKGNVGIGTTAPTSVLDVNGNATVEELKVGHTDNGLTTPRNAISFALSGYGVPTAWNTDSNGDKIVFWNNNINTDCRMGVGDDGQLWVKAMGSAGPKAFEIYGTTANAGTPPKLLSVAKNGAVTLDAANTNVIDSAGSQAVVTKGWVEEKVPSEVKVRIPNNATTQIPLTAGQTLRIFGSITGASGNTATIKNTRGISKVHQISDGGVVSDSTNHVYGDLLVCAQYNASCEISATYNGSSIDFMGKSSGNYQGTYKMREFQGFVNGSVLEIVTTHSESYLYYTIH